uniref:Uncharacterized protein n=1 Tax=Picea sitchensis TaxID=3332 RepID=A9NYG0_PICSI|nr:unknown [Picea sitchensis]
MKKIDAHSVRVKKYYLRRKCLRLQLRRECKMVKRLLSKGKQMKRPTQLLVTLYLWFNKRSIPNSREREMISLLSILYY